MRQATFNDYDFLYQFLVAAIREYVEATWGWQEKWQQEYFAHLDFAIVQDEGIRYKMICPL
jgi:hypothetical protein